MDPMSSTNKTFALILFEWYYTHVHSQILLMHHILSIHKTYAFIFQEERPRSIGNPTSLQKVAEEVPF